MKKITIDLRRTISIKIQRIITIKEILIITIITITMITVILVTEDSFGDIILRGDLMQVIIMILSGMIGTGTLLTLTGTIIIIGPAIIIPTVCGGTIMIIGATICRTLHTSTEHTLRLELEITKETAVPHTDTEHQAEAEENRQLELTIPREKETEIPV